VAFPLQESSELVTRAPQVLQFYLSISRSSSLQELNSTFL